MRPLQARPADKNVKNSQTVESKRKMMEELLSLKQEVSGLRKAAELNEDGNESRIKGASSVAGSQRDELFKRFKD